MPPEMNIKMSQSWSALSLNQPDSIEGKSIEGDFQEAYQGTVTNKYWGSNFTDNAQEDRLTT